MLQNIINDALPKISAWLKTNYLTLNISKTVAQIYTKCRDHATLDIQIDGTHIKEVQTARYLGIFIDSDLKFSSHINSITNIMSRNLGMIARARQYIPKAQLLQLYNALIFPYINYCCFIWGSNYENQIHKLNILQKRAMRIIEGVFPPESATPIFKKYNVLKVKEISHLQILLIMHKHLLNELPKALECLVQLSPHQSHQTRHINHYKATFSAKNYRLFTFACLGPKLWNDIVAKHFSIDQVPRSKQIFKKYLKNLFLNSY